MRLWHIPAMLMVALAAAQNSTNPATPVSVAVSSQVPPSDAPSDAVVSPTPTGSEIPVGSGGPASSAVVSLNETDVPTPTGGNGTDVLSSSGSVTVPTSSGNVTVPTEPPLPPGPSLKDPISMSTYSYSQAPLPGRTVSAPPSAFTVAGGSPPSAPQTRNYDLNLGFAVGRPSGYTRRMSVINNQFPGPLIEGWQGDTLIIKVTNNLDTPQTIHWHGIVQNNTCFMDGIPGISQCPIQPGKSFTYKFELVHEVGTYWYHSHFGHTLADGIYGAFVVHSRDDPIKQNNSGEPGTYDNDVIMFVNDWYHDQSELIIKSLTTNGGGYRGSNIAGMPDSGMINGVGQEDCDFAQPGAVCGITRPSELRAPVGSRVRLRLINPGSRAQMRFSIDNHILEVVQVDNTPIKPLYLQEISIDPGQRYSVIVHLNQANWFSSFWMRANIASGCIAGGNGVMETLGVLRYTDLLGSTWNNDEYPVTAAWDPEYRQEWNEGFCSDIDIDHPVEPLIPNPPPRETYATFRLDSSGGGFISPTGDPYSGFGWNPYMANGTNPGKFTEYKQFIYNPLLRQIEEGLTLNSSRVASITAENPGAVDIIINNRDGGLSHPFHLHGRPAYIMYRKSGGLIKQEEVASLPLNLDNPLERDTFTIPGNGAIVLRLITDTPGVWPLHCHIGWHLAVGKMAVIVVQPDAIRANMARPADWEGLCDGQDPEFWHFGRRQLPPQARRVLDGFTPRAQMPEDESPAKRKRWNSPNGENVPYFSQDNLGFTLIDNGVTIISSFPLRPAPSTTPLATNTEAASQAYATVTQDAAEAFRADPPVPTEVQATEGSLPQNGMRIDGLGSKLPGGPATNLSTARATVIAHPEADQTAVPSSLPVTGTANDAPVSATLTSAPNGAGSATSIAPASVTASAALSARVSAASEVAPAPTEDVAGTAPTVSA